MAGSLKWFVYTTDAGTPYAINADESNVEAANGTTFGWTSADPIDGVPRNFRPRFAVYEGAGGTRTIRIPIMTQEAYNTVQADVPEIPDAISGAGVLTFAYKRPEIIRVPRAADTGLLDGDQP